MCSFRLSVAVWKKIGKLVLEIHFACCLNVRQSSNGITICYILFSLFLFNSLVCISAKQCRSAAQLSYRETRQKSRVACTVSSSQCWSTTRHLSCEQSPAHLCQPHPSWWWCQSAQHHARTAGHQEKVCRETLLCLFYIDSTGCLALTLCWAQRGHLFTSCSAGLVELRSLLEHTDSFAQLL